LPALLEQSAQGLSEDTAGELELKDRTVIESNPLILISGSRLSIKTKDGKLIRLKLNSTQERLFNRIIELRRMKKAVRLWILKYRQGGISTIVEAIIYALTSQQPNRNSLIMADEADKSDHLFQMSKLYQEELEFNSPHLAPALKKSNAKSLEFEKIHSQIIIETAENINATRSKTLQYSHLSECAFFRDLKGVLDGLNQTVPNHWDTMVIGETTANGMNEFYTQWMRAVEGKTDWIPLFFPWFEMAEYSMPLENGQLYPLNGINFDSETSIAQFEQEEQELKEEFKLTDEQINFRRYCIINKCQGDVMRFKTEYPATAQEAFILSGSLFFDRRGLNMQVVQRPIDKGEIFFENLKYQFRSMPHGRIEIYEHPMKDDQYVVAADASEAIGSDEAAIVVLSKLLNKTVAQVVGQHTPEELAAMCIALGNLYNNAIVAPENKGYGYMVCQDVYKQYGNIYKRIITKAGDNKETEELGWNTSSVSRPQMLAQMNEEIKHGSTQLMSKQLIDECRTFIIKKDKQGNVTKVEAQDGCQDGLIISRAIAGMVRNQYPYKHVDVNKRDGLYKRRAEELKARRVRY
jgi:hypothetical protein